MRAHSHNPISTVRYLSPLEKNVNSIEIGFGSISSYPLESLIESFIELMSQVFMLPIFHRRTSC
jgi:hypothetical protein